VEAARGGVGPNYRSHALACSHHLLRLGVVRGGLAGSYKKGCRHTKGGKGRDGADASKGVEGESAQAHWSLTTLRGSTPSRTTRARVAEGLPLRQGPQK